MTPNEMKRVLMLKLEKLHDNSAPAYTDKQYSRFLSDAENRVFLSLTNSEANKYKKGIESNEQRKAELAPFVRYKSLNNGITLSTDLNAVKYPNSYVFRIETRDPIDEKDVFGYIIEERICLDSTYYPWVKPMTHDEYNVDIDNPYKKPYYDKVWRMDNGVTSDGNKLVSIISYLKDNNTLAQITSYIITYLINPQGIVVDEKNPINQKATLFPDIVHNRIVDEAYKMIESILNPEKYQVLKMERLDSE